MNKAQVLRAGDDQSGFELESDPAARLVRMRLWGFWSDAIGQQFVESITNLGRTMFGSPWGVLADSRNFPAQSPQVTELRQTGMNRIAELGCLRIAAVVKSVTYAHQFKRIAGGSGAEGGVFDDAESALAWIREVAPFGK